MRYANALRTLNAAMAAWVATIILGWAAFAEPAAAQGRIAVEGEKEAVLDVAFEVLTARGWQLTNDGRRLLVFEREPTGFGGFMAGVLLGSKYDSSPVARLSISASGRGGTVHLSATANMVTNPGSAFERLTAIDAKHTAELIAYIKNVAEGKPTWSKEEFAGFAPPAEGGGEPGVTVDPATGAQFCATSMRWAESSGGRASVFYACASRADTGACVGYRMIAYDTPCYDCKHKLRIGRKRIRDGRFDGWSQTLFAESAKGKLFNAVRGADADDVLLIERRDEMRKTTVNYAVPIGHLAGEIGAVKIECNGADLRRQSAAL